MFGNIGIPELLIIFLIALLVFGPKKLPQLGKAIGRALAEFRRASNEFQRSLTELDKEIEKEIDKDEEKIEKKLNENDKLLG